MKIALSRARSSLSCPLTPSAEGRSGYTIKKRNVVTKRLLRVMKLTGIIIFAACLHVSAKGLGQHVTLSVKNASLEKVFVEIIMQSGTTIIYNEALIKAAKPVTIEVKNATPREVLDLSLKGQPFYYTQEDGYIIIKPSVNAGLSEDGPSPSLTIPIKGVIRDSEGNPLAGINIVVKGTKHGITTDAQGKFSIDAKENDVLVISSVGYNAREVKIISADAPLMVELQKSISELDATVVIAYGTTSKRLSTGNVSSVSSREIGNTPTTNLLLALQGRVPGITIEQASGHAGSAVKVRVQGENSIANGNDPLYVIDGVPYVQQLVKQLSYIQGNLTSPLNYINPQDIESISILKDADATSIYGSRAANGAILITTKKGKAGDTRVNINVQQGIGQVANRMKLMDRPQYLQMRRQALANDGIDPNEPPYNSEIYRTSVYPDLVYWDTTRSTDWQEVLFGKNAQYTDANLSISGGGNQTTFLVGANYHRETQVFPGATPYGRGSFHFNLSNSSLNQRLRLEVSASYLRDNIRRSGSDLTSTAIKLAPNAPELYNDDGSLNFGVVDSTQMTFNNPLSYQYNNIYKSVTDNLVASATLSYRVAKGLELKSNFGYNVLKQRENSYFLDGLWPAFLYRLYPGWWVRSSDFNNSDFRTWQIEPQITYNTVIKKHTINLLAGTNFQDQYTYSQALSASGFNSDAVLEDISAATNIRAAGMVVTTYRYNGWFGRINYDYDHKYILNLTGRRDGSSRFGEANRLHNFGSIGGAWIFSDENWIRSALPWLSFGKLNVSYGTTGNDNIGDYRYLSLYYNNSTAAPFQPGATLVYPNGFANPYLQWESTSKLQFGFHAGVANNRFLADIVYARNRSSNQLLFYQLPLFTGFAGVQSNFPAIVQNTSLEITLNSQNIQTSTFNWTSSFNLTIPRNKLVAFPGLATSSYANELVVGKSKNIKKLYVFAGVDPESGMYQFKDAEGKLTLTPRTDNTDKTALVNVDPRFYGGLTNRFSYKGWELEFLLQFSSQVGNNFRFGFDVPGYASTNQPAQVVGGWSKPGDNTNVQLYTSGMEYLGYVHATSNFNAQFSDAAFNVINYVRLKNLSLSWQLPSALVKKANIKSMRVYLLGQNLLTFDNNYIGMDPETKSIGLPPLRIITLGLNITL